MEETGGLRPASVEPVPGPAAARDEWTGWKPVIVIVGVLGALPVLVLARSPNASRDIECAPSVRPPPQPPLKRTHPVRAGQIPCFPGERIPFGSTASLIVSTKRR